ncbi:MAG: hypothetical protein GSR84_04650 [Desulfurococcales archaeon]|nr:hypothetical protein [Desulfurococcales archaeon]
MASGVVRDLRGCSMLWGLVAGLEYGHHIYSKSFARVEVNKRQGFTVVWLRLPSGRTVLTAYGDPGNRHEWRCTDPDAVALALLTMEEELAAELAGEGAAG